MIVTQVPPAGKEASTPAYSHFGIAAGSLPKPPGYYFVTPVLQHSNSIKYYGINPDLCQWEGENNQVLRPLLRSSWYCSDLLHTALRSGQLDRITLLLHP